jgi:hypothetical protein
MGHRASRGLTEVVELHLHLRLRASDGGIVLVEHRDQHAVLADQQLGRDHHGISLDVLERLVERRRRVGLVDRGVGATASSRRDDDGEQQSGEATGSDHEGTG